ncbi:uncharacterized protein BN589_00349 [Collinsella sp. CAG:289]|nr:uncharacterized protein BN589_00349 [Collinsella sp. CAG:289]
MKIEQEVTIGDGIERIGNHARKAKLGSGHLAVKRIGGTSKSGSPQRRGIGSVERGNKTLEVAGKHPGVGKQVMGEKHGLCMLQVCVAGQNHIGVLLRRGN